MSKKYVIEINPEYEDATKGVMVLGARESNLYVDALSGEELEELNSDYINEHYGELQDEAYQRGLEDGKKAFDLLDAERDSEYQRGLNDAWEAARKIVADTYHGGFAMGALCEIFGTRSYTYIMNENTAQEAVDKIKAYEDKHSDRIEVGDEEPCLINEQTLQALNSAISVLSEAMDRIKEKLEIFNG